MEGRLEIRRSTDQFSRTVQVFQCMCVISASQVLSVWSAPSPTFFWHLEYEKGHPSTAALKGETQMDVKGSFCPQNGGGGEWRDLGFKVLSVSVHCVKILQQTGDSSIIHLSSLLTVFHPLWVANLRRGLEQTACSGGLEKYVDSFGESFYGTELFRHFCVVFICCSHFS